MKSVRFFLLTFLICGASCSASAAVTASLDRNQIALGETVRLQLQHDGSADSQPDIGALKRDFDVLGTSRGSSVQFINGNTSSQTQISLVLAPKHDGKIVIPPLQWDGQQSAALELTVTSGGAPQGTVPNAATPQGAEAGNSHVFVTATPDQKQPYVQAAIVLTVRLYADEPIYQASLNLPASDDVLIRPLGEDRQTSESRNGHTYQVVERKYLLFPQRSGKLSINGPVLDAQVPDASGNDPFGNDPFFSNAFGRLPLAGMLNSTRPLHLVAKQIELSVKPRPVGATGSNWLPAQRMTLEEQWHPDAQTVHVGEPITRHLHLAALALTGAQLPDLSQLMAVPDGIRTYPDQAKTDDQPQGATVLGSRDQDIALIAQRAGRYMLPALKLSWWDTQHNVQREVALPARTLNVLPAADGSTQLSTPPNPLNSQPSSPQDNAAGSKFSSQPLTFPAQPAKVVNSTRWQWISVALGLLWIATVLAWWYSRRRVPSAAPVTTETAVTNVKADDAFRAFRQACLDNDAHAARRYLIAWAAGVWRTDPPIGLNELSRRMEDAKLSDALRRLDRACYIGGAWQGAELAELLAVPPVGQRTAESKKTTLPELYR